MTTTIPRRNPTTNGWASLSIRYRSDGQPYTSVLYDNDGRTVQCTLRGDYEVTFRRFVNGVVKATCHRSDGSTVGEGEGHTQREAEQALIDVYDELDWIV